MYHPRETVFPEWVSTPPLETDPRHFMKHTRDVPRILGKKCLKRGGPGPKLDVLKAFIL